MSVMVGHTSLLIVTKECCCCTSGFVNKRNSHALLWGACTKMGGLTNLCDTPILTRGRVICSWPEKQGPSPSTSQENRAFSSQGLDFENEGEANWSSGHPSQDGEQDESCNRCRCILQGNIKLMGDQ
ncbi:hypothetical protein ATANTOWER_019427 [Ataeniobius toweri]|uniref:Uncharacterized protein n=1 Tax=Ataeniobius toweri TaxID=208326 RepID=A0ABU7BA51_9TELE|nr:hypothetical protein [Ataeniobius toweri]